MSLMGLDIGTTGTKAIVFGHDGRILSSAYREYPLHSPHPGWLEISPHQVWRNVVEAVNEAARKTKNAVSALAISCLGEAATPITRDGKILHNSILGFDSRAKDLARRWIDANDPMQVMRISGMPPSQMFTIFKIMWLKKHAPAVVKRAWKFLTYEDFAIYKMTGTPVVDYSMACRTMAFDVRAGRWSEKICDDAGVDVSLFPDAKPSGTVVGELGGKAAAELGLSKGCKVVTGGHDQPAGALGAGIIKEKVAIDATGTVECFAPAFSRPVMNRAMLRNNFCCYYHVAPKLYVTLAFNFTGGSLLRWFRDTVAGEEKAEAKRRGVDVYDILLAKMADKPTGLFVLPHFTMTGTPYMDPSPTGAIIGLNLATSKAELIKAVLEGISYEMKLNIELLEEAGVVVDELRAIGGGAKSERWLQLKADMFNKRIVRLKTTEAACQGMAIAAGVATGEYASFSEAVRTVVRPDKVFRPNKLRADEYEEKLATYRKIYPALKTLHRG
jgi:xylulokinase